MKQLYQCKETKRERGRICGIKGTKREVEGFAKAMRKLYGKKYTYRIIKARK